MVTAWSAKPLDAGSNPVLHSNLRGLNVREFGAGVPYYECVLGS